MKALLLTLMTAFTLGYSAWTQAQDTSPGLPALEKASAQAFTFGYPLILMDETRKATVGDNFNRLNHLRQFPDHTFRRVVRPNVDTLYSTIWFNLREGPQVIQLPDSGGRYYVMPLYDAWTNVFASIGSRTTGGGPQTVLLAGPDWQGDVPDGMDFRRSPTNLAWAIARVDTPGGDDLPAAHAFQNGMRLQSFAAYQAGGPVSAALENTGSANGRNPKVRVDDMDAKSFFTRLSRLMVDNPAAPADGPILQGALATLGVAAGVPFPASSFTSPQMMAIKQAIDRTRKQLLGVADRIPKNERFWAGMPGGAILGSYGTRYPLRAYVAMAGLGAVGPEDALYPNTTQDAAGVRLTSDKAYVLHFEADQVPPVNAFWSLTVYNQDFYLADNRIDRYAVGSRDDLMFNADGSLDIYIQRAAPEGVPQANWLPAPASGPMALNMRLYWPKERALSGAWDMPGVQVR